MLKDELWGYSYETGQDDLFTDFYCKALSHAVQYDRAVGYFSAEIIAQALKGISKLVESKGKIRLVIGEPLEPDEFNAVKQGIKAQEYLNNANEQLLSMINDSSGHVKNRLEVLSWLVAANRLEIKFAFRHAGMYHDKIGLIYDEEGNLLAFSGSANETPSAYLQHLNIERITVYKSWEEPMFSAYGKSIVDSFDVIWNNKNENIITLDVPSSVYEKIAALGSEVEYSSLKRELDFEEDLKALQNFDSFSYGAPRIPKLINGKPFEIYDHQKAALQSWKSYGYKGILQLATGTGKTITSIYGAIKTYEARKKRNNRGLFLVIAVPYINLAEQWIDTLRDFNIKAIKAYGERDSWQSVLDSEIKQFSLNKGRFSAVVVVNKTLGTQKFLSFLQKIPVNDFMFIGDECHRHGSKYIQEFLPEAYYRIGLSATPYNDDDDEYEAPFPNLAKENLTRYYGQIAYEYSLDDAIFNGVLCKYKYIPIAVTLTRDEQEAYDELTNKIINAINTKNEDALMRFSLERSRVLGAAENKLPALLELIQNFLPEERKHSLFYCGEGRDDLGERLIDTYTKSINSLRWRVSQFTAEVKPTNRTRIMKEFKEGIIDGLVAMKILDEGIDIPACSKAFIVASTKNKRQYVQRRGRILRKSRGKDYAVIYDFVTLPHQIASEKSSMRLLQSEYERVMDFLMSADNRADVQRFIDEHGFTKYE